MLTFKCKIIVSTKIPVTLQMYFLHFEWSLSEQPSIHKSIIV